MELIDTINRNLKSSQGKILDFYGTLIGGIIGGLIISYIIFYSQRMPLSRFLFFIIVVIFLWYLIGLWIINHNIKNTILSKKKHIRNYNINITASILGAIYVSIIAISFEKDFFNLILLLDTLGMSLIALLIMVFVIAKK